MGGWLADFTQAAQNSSSSGDDGISRSSSSSSSKVAAAAVEIKAAAEPSVPACLLPCFLACFPASLPACLPPASCLPVSMTGAMKVAEMWATHSALAHFQCRKASHSHPSVAVQLSIAREGRVGGETQTGKGRGRQGRRKGERKGSERLEMKANEGRRERKEEEMQCKQWFREER